MEIFLFDPHLSVTASNAAPMDQADLRILYNRAIQIAQKIRLYIIVGVNKSHPFPTSLLKPHIPSRTHTFVCLMKDPNPRIGSSQSVTNNSGLIIAAIINQKQFKIRECLLEKTFNTFLQILSGIIYGNYNRNHNRLSTNKTDYFQNRHLK